MKQDAAEILKKALELPPEAQAAIAGSLLDSLDQTLDDNVEAAWEDEILLRLKDIDEGRVNLVPRAEARRLITVSNGTVNL